MGGVVGLLDQWLSIWMVIEPLDVEAIESSWSGWSSRVKVRFFLVPWILTFWDAVPVSLMKPLLVVALMRPPIVSGMVMRIEPLELRSEKGLAASVEAI